MRDTSDLHIGGRWTPPVDGERFSTVDPATEASLAEVTAAKAADVDPDGDAAAETVSTIEADGSDGAAGAVTTDLSDPEDVASFVERTVEAFGRIDVLHDNAGISQESTPVEDVTEQTWDRIQDVNLKSAFLGAKYSVPYVREHGGGVIQNTGSTAGIRPRTGLSAYAASKGGTSTLTKQLARELAEDGIRVNAIRPIATDTDMLPELAAAFFASEEASMVTGTAHEVDGGRDS